MPKKQSKSKKPARRTNKKAVRPSRSSNSLATRMASTKKSAKGMSQMDKFFGFFQFPRLHTFFSERRNVVGVLVLIVIFGLLYLFKDVFIVAIVNGQPIYRWTVVKELEQQGGDQVMNTLVVETLARQAVKEAGVTVDQADIDAYVKDVEDRATQQGYTLDSLLAQQGLTRDQWLDNLRLQREVEKLVGSDITVSENEINQYLDDNAAYLPSDLSEQELHDQAAEQVRSNKLTQAIQDWIQELQSNAKILYLKQYTSAQTSPTGN